MIAVRPISSGEILSSTALLAEYSEECSIRSLGPINPQPAMYQEMERCGLLSCFGAFDEAEMIGFATVLVTVLPHYGVYSATVESLFVAKEKRYTGAGTELMQAVEIAAKSRGCADILYSALAGSELVRLLAAKKSYVHTNTIFCRKLI